MTATTEVAIGDLAPRPSRGGLWQGLAAVALASTVVVLAVVVGFLVIGIASDPVDLITLATQPVWDPNSGTFGAAAMIFGTIAVSAMALALAAPIGRAAAIAITETPSPSLHRLLRTASEFLAVVPSIVYGLVGIVVARPLVSSLTGVPGGDGLLTAGIVLGVMVLPTVVALSVDALESVPPETREVARSLGLLDNEVVRDAVVPAARAGLRAALLLALARALGETIAVFLLVGRADGRLPNPAGVLVALTRPGQTITSKLGGPEPVLSGGRGEHWAALCAIALLLFVIVIVLTLLADRGSARVPVQSLRGSFSSRRARVAGTFDRSMLSVRKARNLRNRSARTLRIVAVGIPITMSVLLFGLTMERGRRVFQPSFWWSRSVGADGGGIRDQIIGTALVTSVAALLATPIALGLALCYTEFARSRSSRALQVTIVTLGGLPSILLGIAGYRVLSVGAGMGKSWLIGSILLAVIIVPIAALSVGAQIESVPSEERETAAALGLRRGQLITSVIWPRARRGLITGVFLGSARAAGETAPLLFAATVFSGASLIPSGIRDAPVQTLPTHLFTLSQDSARPEAAAAAWGSAAALMLVVAGCLAVAVALRGRYAPRALERGGGGRS